MFWQRNRKKTTLQIKQEMLAILLEIEGLFASLRRNNDEAVSDFEVPILSNEITTIRQILEGQDLDRQVFERAVNALITPVNNLKSDTPLEAKFKFACLELITQLGIYSAILLLLIFCFPHALTIAQPLQALCAFLVLTGIRIKKNADELEASPSPNLAPDNSSSSWDLFWINKRVEFFTPAVRMKEKTQKLSKLAGLLISNIQKPSSFQGEGIRLNAS